VPTLIVNASEPQMAEFLTGVKGLSGINFGVGEKEILENGVAVYRKSDLEYEFKGFSDEIRHQLPSDLYELFERMLALGCYISYTVKFPDQ